MKRIGIDARLWGETGVGRYIRNLVAELQKIDTVNEYVLFVLGKDSDQVKFKISNLKFKIRIVDIPWHTITEQRELPKILEKEKLDLMHFPYFSVPILYNGPYVLTIHDLILHHFPTGKASTKSTFTYWAKHAAYKYIIYQAAKKAAKIITVSHATKDEIIDHLKIPNEKIEVTYEGVDRKITNYKSQITNNDFKYFLYVGNAYPHKNLETLLDAFSLLTHSKTNSQFPLVGENNLKLILVGKQDYFYKRLEERVKKLRLVDSVVFKHDVTDAELAEYYTHALALVASSLMEGFGLPVLEAMANKCLVVASDIPVFREIAGDIPLYVNPVDVQDIANMLESIAKGRILDAKERKEKGKEQAERFSWEEMAKQTQKVYQNSVGV